MGDFIPLFLVQFPYNYLGQNEHFKPYVIREIVKWGFWLKILVLWHVCGAPRLLCKIRKSKGYNFTNDYMNLACT